MREGLSAACDAARPRLCRFLRRILRPKPAFRPTQARYSPQVWVCSGSGSNKSRGGLDSSLLWMRVRPKSLLEEGKSEWQFMSPTSTQPGVHVD